MPDLDAAAIKAQYDQRFADTNREGFLNGNLDAAHSAVYPKDYDPRLELGSEDFTRRVRDGISTALSLSGFNTSDPLDHSVRFFNRHRIQVIDPLMLGSTHIFFTRPDLNFRTALNLRYEPLFEYFATMKLGQKVMGMLMSPFEPDNYQTRILGLGDIGREKGGFKLSPDLVPFSPFIPLLSNTCVESSGAKDLIIESYDTQGDYSGTKLTYARGADETQTVSDLSLSFSDVYSGPTSLLFLLWMTYIHDVGKGIVRPLSYHVLERSIDYMSSIYVLMVGPDQKTILRFVKYTGCYPTSLSLGAVQHTKDLTAEALRNVSVTMRYNRLEYLNPKILGDFNTISSPFISFGEKEAQPPGHALPRGSGVNSVMNPLEDSYMANHWHRHPYISGNRLLFLNNNKDVYESQRKSWEHTQELDDWDTAQ